MLRAKAGDQSAFEYLVQKYRRPMVSFMYRMARNAAAAEDLAQEVFLRVYRSRESYEATAKFTTWLYRIATNLAVNHARDTRHERPEVQVSLDEPDEETGTTLELPDGNIWCATTDRIWRFDGTDWSEVRGGFDGINSLVRARRDGSVWVASNGGLHRFTQEGWVENGTEEGLPSMTIRALLEDQRGRLWAGTTHGLSLYDPEADRDPPQTQVEPLPEREKNIHEGGAVTLRFGGQDKWKQTARERLLYSYRLDEREWSPFQEARQATFSELLAGKHTFQVRAMDRNCNVRSKPAQLDFVVVLPWYKETRLVLISMAGVALALFFAGVAFNRHRRLVRSYAEVEQKVAERTRELEIASRELLHSQKMNALGALAAGIAHDSFHHQRFGADH